MIASIVHTFQLVELMVVSIVAAGSAGVGIGRYTKRAYKTHHEEEVKFNAEHEAIIQSLIGTPATQWSPARAGLVAAMAQVQDNYERIDVRMRGIENIVYERPCKPTRVRSKKDPVVSSEDEG